MADDSSFDGDDAYYPTLGDSSFFNDVQNSYGDGRIQCPSAIVEQLQTQEEEARRSDHMLADKLDEISRRLRGGTPNSSPKEATPPMPLKDLLCAVEKRLKEKVIENSVEMLPNDSTKSCPGTPRRYKPVITPRRLPLATSTPKRPRSPPKTCPESVIGDNSRRGCPKSLERRVPRQKCRSSSCQGSPVRQLQTFPFQDEISVVDDDFELLGVTDVGYSDYSDSLTRRESSRPGTPRRRTRSPRSILSPDETCATEDFEGSGTHNPFEDTDFNESNSNWTNRSITPFTSFTLGTPSRRARRSMSPHLGNVTFSDDSSSLPSWHELDSEDFHGSRKPARRRLFSRSQSPENVTFSEDSLSLPSWHELDSEDFQNSRRPTFSPATPPEIRAKRRLTPPRAPSPNYHFSPDILDDVNWADYPNKTVGEIMEILERKRGGGKPPCAADPYENIDLGAYPGKSAKEILLLKRREEDELYNYLASEIVREKPRTPNRNLPRLIPRRKWSPERIAWIGRNLGLKGSPYKTPPFKRRWPKDQIELTSPPPGFFDIDEIELSL